MSHSMVKFAAIVIALFSSLSNTLFAAEEKDVRVKARTVFGLYLTPREAYEMKTREGDQVLLVDIRTRAELKYVGSSALIDANIPARFLKLDYAWSAKSSTYRTRSNPSFVADMKLMLKKKGADMSTPIILMCTSGTRAPKAAELLKQAGFTQIYSQYQGFEGTKAKSGADMGHRVVDGWKNDNLPWTYTLSQESMYFNFNSTSEAQAE